MRTRRSRTRRRRRARRRPPLHQERSRGQGNRRPDGLVRSASGPTRWISRTTSSSLLDASKFGTQGVHALRSLHQGPVRILQGGAWRERSRVGRSAVDLAEFQEDAVKKARRILARYDGVLIADSVGLGKTWIGKKLLEDFAYHRRQKAVVVCPASLREMWHKELATATIAAQVVGMEELGRDNFRCPALRRCRCHSDRREPQLPQRQGQPLPGPGHDDSIERRPRPGRRTQEGHPSCRPRPINNDLYDLANQVRLFTQSQPDYFREAGIGDFNAYFRRAPDAGHQQGRRSCGRALFNLLEEIMVRNTRPYIRAAYPNATIKGKPVAFPNGGCTPSNTTWERPTAGCTTTSWRPSNPPLPGTVQAGSLQEKVGHRG